MWGPLIAYEGHACKDWEKYLEINASGLSEKHNAIGLQLLLGQLDVTINEDGYFKALEPNYFE